MGDVLGAKFSQVRENTNYTGKTTLVATITRMRGEKELSPEVRVTKVEIYQGQAEVG